MKKSQEKNKNDVNELRSDRKQALVSMSNKVYIANMTKFENSLFRLNLSHVILVNHGDMVPTEFESVTVRLEGECSIQLSYGTKI